jgi:hypothetical protein
MLVTIATYPSPIEAHIFAGRLEAEGIPCVLEDEHIVAANWLYSNAVGGVKLRVRRDQAESAVAILQQMEPAGEDGTLDSCDRALEAEVAEEDDSPACPSCHSKNVRYQKYARRLVFASWLFLGFPLPFLRRKWVCGDCEHEFTVDAESRHFSS